MSKFLKWFIFVLIILTAFSVAVAQSGTTLYFPLVYQQPTPTPTATATPTNTPTPTTTATPKVSPTPTFNVFIDEIEPDPPKDKPLDEYVQIKNSSGRSVDMEEWRLRDEEGNIFFFPSFTLSNNATVKVWTKAGTNSASNLYWGRDEEVWNDHGDCAYLRDENNEKVASKCYSSSLSWFLELLP